MADASPALSPHPSQDAGFSTLEAVVAMTIAALALLALLDGLSIGVRGLDSAASAARATTALQSALAASSTLSDAQIIGGKVLPDTLSADDFRIVLSVKRHQRLTNGRWVTARTVHAPGSRSPERSLTTLQITPPDSPGRPP